MTTYSLPGFVHRLWTSGRDPYGHSTASAELVLSSETTLLEMVLPGRDAPSPETHVAGSFFAGILRSHDIAATGTSYDIRSATGTTRLVTWESGQTSTVLFLYAGGPSGFEESEHFSFAFVLDGAPWPQADFKAAPWEFYEVAHNAPLSTSGQFAIGQPLDIAGLATAAEQESDLPMTPPPGTGGDDLMQGLPGPDQMVGLQGSDTIHGGGGDDLLIGDESRVLTGERFANLLFGDAGNDTLIGGIGHDTLIGGDGDDVILGGPTGASDLRDLIFAGSGNDRIEAGQGNDEAYGGDGNDTMSGNQGADFLAGQRGDDVLSGGALSDMLFGNDGADFLNGGWGHDRLNGGDGADRFYHAAVAGHGTDWVQDYSHAEGDRLVVENDRAAHDFQVNFAETEGAGEAGTAEAFIIYRPTGQILWALVDGARQDQITISIDQTDHDLLI
ncbi:MAG: calcium-binding protein [Jhaorihella sp.]